MNEILIDRLENQIEAMLDTIIEIEKEEKKIPMRMMSDWHQTSLGMVFFNQVLMKNCWHTRLKSLTPEQSMGYIEEIWNMTHEHFLNLYWYNSKKLWN